MNTITKQDTLKQFYAHIMSGVEEWTKAGRLIVTLLDDQGMSYDEILNECEGLSCNILQRFEQIGRKQVYPQLLINTSAGCRKLASMPYSQQVKYANEPIPVVIKNETGTDQILVKSSDLSTYQVRQVFSKDGVRTLGAQRAWIEDQERAAANAVDVDPEQWELPWIVKGKQVIITKSCKMTRRELLSILNEIG